MGVILIVSIMAAIFAYLGYRNTNDPKKYTIEADEQFAGVLYKDFTTRLTSDPTFVTKAKEALVNYQPSQ